MKATVSVICYKSKLLSNNEHPLMLRVSQNGKKRYQSLNLSVSEKHWDFEKNKPKRSCPNKLQIEKIIADKLEHYTNKILEYKTFDKEYTIDTLLTDVRKPNIRCTVKELFDSQIERLKKADRYNYASSTKHLYNSLIKFNTHLNIPFSDINISWLRKYEAFLRSNQSSENTIGIRLRTFRVVYNIAIEEGYVKPSSYPFNQYKISKIKATTPKRALTKVDVNRIINYKATEYKTTLARDIFTFSYLMGGINFIDICHLTIDNIIENQLIYTRHKTKKLIRLPLHSNAKAIIEKYFNSDKPYIFPILSSEHNTPQKRQNRVRKVIKAFNKELRDIGTELKLPIALTTYVARHSFATVLKRSGVSTSIICESLGHSSEKVTQIYLDSFENSQIDEAMKNLL